MGGVLLIQSTKSNICLPTVAKDCAHIGKWDNSQRNSLKYRDRRLSHMTPAVWRVVCTGVTLESETFNAQNCAQYLKTIVYSEIFGTGFHPLGGDRDQESCVSGSVWSGVRMLISLDKSFRRPEYYNTSFRHFPLSRRECHNNSFDHILLGVHRCSQPFHF